MINYGSPKKLLTGLAKKFYGNYSIRQLNGNLFYPPASGQLIQARFIMALLIIL